MFAQAYIQAATMSTAISTFRKCGISAFSSIASRTNLPLINVEPETASLTAEIRQQQPSVEQDSIEQNLLATISHHRTPISEPHPRRSMQNEDSLIGSLIQKVCRDSTSSFENTSPTEILAISIVEKRNQSRKNYRCCSHFNPLQKGVGRRRAAKTDEEM